MHVTEAQIRLEEFFAAPAARATGAVAAFAGIVRDDDGGRPVKRLHYECYRPMAEKVIAGLIAEAQRRWAVDAVRVVHRVGELAIGDAAVAIAVHAAHREEAFAACRFLIERIKHEVPIWKKQTYADGSGEWVSCSAHAEESR